MGRLTATLGALVLVVAACSGSASPAATPVPATPTPVVATPAPVTPAPTATPVAISAAVTWDGQTCTYAGPTVIPRGAVVTFKMTSTPAALKGLRGGGLFVMPVLDGTTWEQVLAAREKADGTRAHTSDEPSWVFLPGGVGDSEVQILYPESANAGETLTTVMTRNTYFVMCGTPENDYGYPAILLKVLPG